MHEVVAWCGFFGAWFLVAGPTYQAVRELEAEDVAFDRIREVGSHVQRRHISWWWWLLPPVQLWLQNRSRDRYQRDLMNALSDEDYEALTSYFNTARGWMLVGLGGLLIAVKETFELTDLLGWSLLVGILLIVLMLALSIGQAVASSVRDRRERVKRRQRQV